MLFVELLLLLLLLFLFILFIFMTIICGLCLHVHVHVHRALVLVLALALPLKSLSSRSRHGPLIGHSPRSFDFVCSFAVQCHDKRNGNCNDKQPFRATANAKLQHCLACLAWCVRVRQGKDVSNYFDSFHGGWPAALATVFGLQAGTVPAEKKEKASE